MSFSDLRNVWSSSQSNHLLRHQQAKKKLQGRNKPSLFQPKVSTARVFQSTKVQVFHGSSLVPGRIGILRLLSRKKTHWPSRTWWIWIPKSSVDMLRFRYSTNLYRVFHLYSSGCRISENHQLQLCNKASANDGKNQ